jgi:hypothetical protein
LFFRIVSTIQSSVTPKLTLALAASEARFLSQRRNLQITLAGAASEPRQAY